MISRSGPAMCPSFWKAMAGAGADREVFCAIRVPTPDALGGCRA
jgi:hypothetical protein